MEAIARQTALLMGQYEGPAASTADADSALASAGATPRRGRTWPIMVVLTGLALNVAWCGFLVWQATDLVVGLVVH
jgi:hypothetical protein